MGVRLRHGCFHGLHRGRVSHGCHRRELEHIGWDQWNRRRRRGLECIGCSPGGGDNTITIEGGNEAGESGLYLGLGELSNGGFENGTTDWTEAGQSSLQVSGSLAAAAGTSAPEGGQMAWASIQAPINYHEWEHQFCPVPGSEVTITFEWQVVTEDFGACSSGNPNWLNLRIDKDEGNEEIWGAEWAEVCPLLATDSLGWVRTTGWQTESVTVTAPTTSAPNSVALAFSIGGFNYDAWYGLVDDIQVSAK